MNDERRVAGSVSPPLLRPDPARVLCVGVDPLGAVAARLGFVDGGRRVDPEVRKQMEDPDSERSHRGPGGEVLPERGGVGPILVPKIEHRRREPAECPADHLVQVVAGHVQPRHLATRTRTRVTVAAAAAAAAGGRTPPHR